MCAYMIIDTDIIQDTALYCLKGVFYILSDNQYQGNHGAQRCFVAR